MLGLFEAVLDKRQAFSSHFQGCHRDSPRVKDIYLSVKRWNHEQQKCFAVDKNMFSLYCHSGIRNQLQTARATNLPFQEDVSGHEQHSKPAVLHLNILCLRMKLEHCICC